VPTQGGGSVIEVLGARIVVSRGFDAELLDPESTGIFEGSASSAGASVVEHGFTELHHDALEDRRCWRRFCKTKIASYLA
jgi:hypothetical protein